MQNSALEGVSLLLVQPSQQLREQLTSFLQDKCLELIVAKTGKSAIQKYQQHQPSIVLTQRQLPDIDGLYLSELILNDKLHTPIVITSHDDNSQDILKALKLGVIDFLIEPISENTLLESLEKIANKYLQNEAARINESLYAQYKCIVDKNSIVSKTDKNGVITYINDAFVNISGYQKEELIGNKHNMIRHPDEKSELFRELWETILSKKVWKGVIKNRAKDGSTYIVSSVITPILDKNNKIIECISLRQDITESELHKIQLKNKLNDNSKFIYEFERAIKEHTIFCRTSVSADIMMTSKKFNTIFGYEDHELEGVNYSTLLRIKNPKKIYLEIQSSMQNAHAWHGLLKHRAKDKSPIYLESSFIPLLGLKGKVVEVFCFFVDTTQNVKLSKDIIHAQREVISTMGTIGERRSLETGLHVKRVAEYSKVLALKYGLSKLQAEELKMASPMHDIGKIAIPDNILNKPGQLTVEEFKIMKTHSQLGYEMLKNSDQSLLKASAIVAHQHHEKWDGTGYPNALKGEEIHIYGRITAILDVFDALGHDRVYKKAWAIEDVIELLKDGRGTHFDPTLIDIFMDNLVDFLRIQKNFDLSTSITQSF